MFMCRQLIESSATALQDNDLKWNHPFLTSTLSQRKGRAPQPSITLSSASRRGSASQGGPPHQWQWPHIHDSIRLIRLTVVLDLKTPLTHAYTAVFCLSCARTESAGASFRGNWKTVHLWIFTSMISRTESNIKAHAICELSWQQASLGS